jgi:hypothetical protein
MGTAPEAQQLVVNARNVLFSWLYWFVRVFTAITRAITQLLQEGLRAWCAQGGIE